MKGVRKYIISKILLKCGRKIFQDLIPMDLCSQDLPDLISCCVLLAPSAPATQVSFIFLGLRLLLSQGLHLGCPSA